MVALTVLPVVGPAAVPIVLAGPSGAVVATSATATAAATAAAATTAAATTAATTTAAATAVASGGATVATCGTAAGLASGWASVLTGPVGWFVVGASSTNDLTTTSPHYRYDCWKPVVHESDEVEGGVPSNGMPLRDLLHDERVRKCDLYFRDDNAEQFPRHPEFIVTNVWHGTRSFMYPLSKCPWEVMLRWPIMPLLSCRVLVVGIILCEMSFLSY